MIVTRVRRERQVMGSGGRPVLELQCDICNRTLQEPGALIFSPPPKESWIVEKYHVCIDCWPVAALLKRQTSDDRLSN